MALIDPAWHHLPACLPARLPARLPDVAVNPTRTPRGIAALIGLCIALPGTGIEAQDQEPPAVPGFLVGAFVDDYGIEYTITETSWEQGSEARYEISEWNPAERYLLVSARGPGAFDAELWTRIDWVELGGVGVEYPWAFCYAAYDMVSVEAARAVVASERETPRTGCNGFPFSRMKPTGQMRPGR